MEKIIDNAKYEMYRLNISFKDSGHYTNAYILKDKNTSNCIVIDPAYNGKYISECVNILNAKLTVIYLTHCHGDHTAALEELYNTNNDNNVKILIHEKDKQGIFDEEKNCKYILSEPNFERLTEEDIDTVKDGDVLCIGDINLKVIHTPGHTNGCTMLYEKEEKILITGDTLFSDCYGRTDLKSSSILDMKQSLNKVFEQFDNDVMIYPGHGDACLFGDAKRRVSVMISFC